MELSKARHNILNLTAVVVLGAVTLVGCGEGGSDESGASSGSGDSGGSISQCEAWRMLGDSDCDGVLDQFDKHPGVDDLAFDSDGDGIPDMVDLYYGANYDDDDRDGYANWLDDQPDNPQVTVANIPSAQDISSYYDNQAKKQSAKVISDNERQAEAYSEMAKHLKNDYANQDSDNDGTSDNFDALPYLNNFSDDDGDGYVNGSDHFPYTQGWH